MFSCRMSQDVQDLVLIEGFLQLAVLTHQLNCLRCLSLVSFFFFLLCMFSFHFSLPSWLLTHVQISKIKQMMLRDAGDGPVRPIIGTFYDHVQVNFHIYCLHHSKSRFYLCWGIEVFPDSVYTLNL